MLQDFKIILDMLLASIGAFFSFLAFLFNFAMNSGISLSLMEMLQCLFIAALLSGSAFLAAAEAEKKDHKRFSHFILGFFIPYLYPLIIHFTLPQAVIRQTGEQRPEDRMREESQKDLTVKLKDKQKDTLARFAHKSEFVEPQPEKATASTENPQETVFVQQSEIFKETEKNPDQSKQPPAPAAEPATDFQKYYSSISTDESGKPTGPFILELADGRNVEALKITAAMPEQMEIEISSGQENSPPRRIRLPYSKISKCTLKAQWING